MSVYRTDTPPKFRERSALKRSLRPSELLWQGHDRNEIIRRTTKKDSSLKYGRWVICRFRVWTYQDGLSPRRTGFNPTPVHVNKLAKGQILLRIPYTLESNPHPFYSFRGLKNQMRIRNACGLDSRSSAGFWKNYRAAVRAVRTIQYNNLLFYLLFIILYYHKHLESFEMCCWRRMVKISWTDHVRN